MEAIIRSTPEARYDVCILMSLATEYTALNLVLRILQTDCLAIQRRHRAQPGWLTDISCIEVTSATTVRHQISMRSF